MFGAPPAGQIDYTQVVNIDLSQVEASVAGGTPARIKEPVWEM